MSQNYCSDTRSADVQILIHHIYEFKKGVRNMVLYTMCSSERNNAESILKQRGISFFTEVVNAHKVNIFFGNPDCIKVIKSFGLISLSEYSPEQDFILGIMLGYNRDQQCNRYLQKIVKEQNILSLLLHTKIFCCLNRVKL